MSGRDGDWDAYLTDFHSRRAGRTEELIDRLTAAGMTPYDWVLRPVAGRGRRVLDLACGSGPVAGRLWDEAVHPLVVGVDRSAAELHRARRVHRIPVVRGDAAQLPFAVDAFDAVVASMALMVVTSLPAVLDECARVLRPGGVLSATVASPLPLRPSDLIPLARLTRRLGGTPQFPGGGEMTGLRGELKRAGFDILEDGRERFGFRVRDAADAALLIGTLYLPRISPDRLESAIAWLTEAAERSPDGFDVAIPIRRVFAMCR